MNPYEPIFKEIANGLLQTVDQKPNFSNDCFIDIKTFTDLDTFCLVKDYNK